MSQLVFPFFGLVVLISLETIGGKKKSTNVDKVSFWVPETINEPAPLDHIVKLVEDAVKISKNAKQFENQQLSSVKQVAKYDELTFYRGARAGPARFKAAYVDPKSPQYPSCLVDFITDGKPLKEAEVAKVRVAFCGSLP